MISIYYSSCTNDWKIVVCKDLIQTFPFKQFSVDWQKVILHMKANQQQNIFITSKNLRFSNLNFFCKYVNWLVAYTHWLLFGGEESSRVFGNLHTAIPSFRGMCTGLGKKRKIILITFSMHLRGFFRLNFPQEWVVFNLDAHYIFCVKLIYFYKTFHLNYDFK